MPAKKSKCFWSVYNNGGGLNSSREDTFKTRTEAVKFKNSLMNSKDKNMKSARKMGIVWFVKKDCVKRR